MIATQPARPGASDFFLESESCACLNEVCQATLPQSHVVRRIDPRTGRQEVKAVCPYCRAQYEATRVLSDGRWKTIAFHFDPAPGFEPIGGTPPPEFEADPFAAAHAEADAPDDDPPGGGDEYGEAGGAAGSAGPTPGPTPLDAPAVERLDTDCDAAAAAAARELTFDASTAQCDPAMPDPD